MVHFGLVFGSKDLLSVVVVIVCSLSWTGELTCVGDTRIGDLNGLNRKFDPSIFLRLFAGADILVTWFTISGDRLITD